MTPEDEHRPDGRTDETIIVRRETSAQAPRDGGRDAREGSRGDGRDTPRDDSRARRDPWAIRAEDTEPYVALQYVARLFKIVAMVVIVALSAEIVAGVVYEGADAVLPLIAEVVKGGVLAAILWGVSDLTLLFIDVGHDVRAQRVLLGRLSSRSGADLGPGGRRAVEGDDDEDGA